MVSLCGKNIFLSLIHFVPLDQILWIKCSHTDASEHPEVIEGRRRLIAMDFLDTKEEY